MHNQYAIKVCGMREQSNIAALASLQPDYIGFIFYPASPRFVGEAPALPETPEGIKRVGVFVNETVSTVLKAVESHQLDYVQLHGRETPAMCSVLQQHLPVIKAISIDLEADFAITKAYQDCAHFLFDTRTPAYGGSGKKFNWEILEAYEGRQSFFLSGGIGPRDVQRINALPEQVREKIAAIDLNSRFEIAPAQKDIAQLSAFFQSLHAA